MSGLVPRDMGGLVQCQPVTSHASRVLPETTAAEARSTGAPQPAHRLTEVGNQISPHPVLGLQGLRQRCTPRGLGECVLQNSRLSTRLAAVHTNEPVLAPPSDEGTLAAAHPALWGVWLLFCPQSYSPALLVCLPRSRRVTCFAG